MSKAKPKSSGTHRTCSVIDCKDQSMYAHRVPAQKDLNAKWINFIFDGRVPVVVKPNLHVCHNHFTLDDYDNMAMIKAGFAGRMLLKRGAMPTIRQLTSGLCNIMANSPVGPDTCSVVGCQDQSIYTHRVPDKEDDIQSKWIHFIFDGQVPASIPKSWRLFVCKHHFSPDAYENIGMIMAGFAGRLMLKRGAIPTIRFLASSSQQENTRNQCTSTVSTPLMLKVEDRDKDMVFVQYQRSSDIGCQTYPQQKTNTTNVGTQLSKNTLVYRRSQGSQASVLSVSVAIGTPVQWKRPPPIQSSTFRGPFKPSKRQRLKPDDDHGVFTDPYIPGESVSTESMLSQASPSINDVPKYIVDEYCLLQLFEDCPACGFMCEVQKTTRGTFLAVHQLCLQCNFSRNWTSQPLEVVPAGEPRSCTSDPESSAAAITEIIGFSDEKDSSDEGSSEVDQGEHNSDSDWDPLEVVPAGEPRSCTSDPESSAAAITEIIGFSDEKDSSDEGSSEVDQGEHNSDCDWDPLKHHNIDDKLADSESDTYADSEADTYADSESDADEEHCRKLCPDCGTFFNSQKKKAHICENKKPYSCVVCGKRFLAEGPLKAHNKIHEDGYKHECKYCYSTFRTRSDRLVHEQSHPSAEKPYQCPDCPEVFAKMRERSDHLLSHRGPTRHICLICNMEFSKKCKLNRHVVVHTKAKTFVCKVCQRSFTQSSHLKSHMRVHTGEKPYQCQHCDESFNHNVTLKSHIQRYHGEVPDSGMKVQMEKISMHVSEVEKGETNQMDRSAVDVEGAKMHETESSCVDADEAEQSNTLHNPENVGGNEEKKEVETRKKFTGRPIGRPKKNAVITLDDANQLKRLSCVSNENEKGQGNSDSTDEEQDSDPIFEPSKRKRRKKKKVNLQT